MGEHSIVEIADALNSGIDIHDITFIKGTVYKTKSLDSVYDYIMLPEFSEILENKKAFAKSFGIQYENTDAFIAKVLVEKYKDTEYVVQNVPSMPLTTQEMDEVYDLPYMRNYHPSYESQGGIPAVNELRNSITSCRGCYGACSFCALTFHQGRIISSRSHESILKEAHTITEQADFKGYIHDVGGPTANFRQPACDKQLSKGACKKRQCLFPTPCPNMKVDHKDYVSLLRKLRSLPKVKKVFIKSGIRFDYLINDKDDTFINELCKYHVSGQLKVAPEHISDNVLSVMGKPPVSVYNRFIKKYREINNRNNMKQYVVPYLMSSHPGSTLKEAIELAEFVRDMGYMPEQVQDFYPTPATISTCIYYTGIDPRTMDKVYVPKTYHEKAMQRALIQYANPDNYDLVKEALIKGHRQDLIGNGPKCLIKEYKIRNPKGNMSKKSISQKKNDTNSKKNLVKNNIKKKKTIRKVHKKKKYDR